MAYGSQPYGFNSATTTSGSFSGLHGTVSCQHFEREGAYKWGGGMVARERCFPGQGDPAADGVGARCSRGTYSGMGMLASVCVCSWQLAEPWEGSGSAASVAPWGHRGSLGTLTMGHRHRGTGEVQGASRTFHALERHSERSRPIKAASTLLVPVCSDQLPSPV